MTREFTAAEIEQGILAALRAGDLHVVPDLLRVLALRDPGRAQLLLDAIKLGIAMRTTDLGVL